MVNEGLARIMDTRVETDLHHEVLLLIYRQEGITYLDPVTAAASLQVPLAVVLDSFRDLERQGFVTEAEADIYELTTAGQQAIQTRSGTAKAAA